MAGHARSENSLSFSDFIFPIDDLHSESNVDENQNPNPSLDGDFLGFFIDENKSRKAQAEGIVFCGKVIDTSRSTDQNPNYHNNNHTHGLARRNSDSLCSSKYSNADNSSLWGTRSKSAPVLAGKKEGGCNKNIERTTTSKMGCSSKSRWDIFGSGRYPTKMELGDLRSRQLRFNKHGGEEEKKRIPMLIRVLGCVGGFDHDHEMMIKGSTTGGAYVSSY